MLCGKEITQKRIVGLWSKTRLFLLCNIIKNPGNYGKWWCSIVLANYLPTKDLITYLIIPDKCLQIYWVVEMLPGSLRLVAQHHVSRPNQTTFLLSSSLSALFPQKHLCHPWRGYKTLPHLMDFPLTVKPKLSHTIRWQMHKKTLLTQTLYP